MRTRNQRLATWTAALALAAVAGMPACAPAEPAPGTTRAQDDHEALFDALLATATPRARVLASMITGIQHVDAAAAKAQGIALRRRARDEAPDDAFVQWFVASSLADAATATQAAQDLARIDPGNGATWVIIAANASRAGDAAGVTQALVRIGAAPRFDEHLGAMTLEWLKAVEAHSATRGTDPIAAKDSAYAAVAQPLVTAIAFSTAVAIPAYQMLVDACRADRHSLEPARREACAAAGRAIATHATSLVSRAIGLALLRHAGDARHAMLQREYGYLSEATVSLSESALRDPESARVHVADWRETGSEIAVIERLLARAGRPPRPPADWQPARLARAPHDG